MLGRYSCIIAFLLSAGHAWAQIANSANGITNLAANQALAATIFQQVSSAANTAAFTLTDAQETPTVAGGQLAGVNLTGTLAADANITTRTATQLATAVAAVNGNSVGFTYILRLASSGAGAHVWTLVGGVGVTVTGYVNIRQHYSGSFLVTVTSATTATMQYIGP